MTITNNSFSPAQISFDKTDLTLSDNGIEVADQLKYINLGNPNSILNMPLDGLTINSGASFIIIYPLIGTPTQVGILQGDWKKLVLQYSDSTPLRIFTPKPFILKPIIQTSLNISKPEPET